MDFFVTKKVNEAGQARCSVEHLSGSFSFDITQAEASKILMGDKNTIGIFTRLFSIADKNKRKSSERHSVKKDIPRC
jgi:hypothetical protein